MSGYAASALLAILALLMSESMLLSGLIFWLGGAIFVLLIAYANWPDPTAAAPTSDRWRAAREAMQDPAGVDAVHEADAREESRRARRVRNAGR